MTPEERAFCEEIRAQALKIVAITGLIEQDAEAGSRQAWRANRASQALLALAQHAGQRVTRADVAAEHQAVADAGYDLAALAVALPARIEE